ncbi:MAG: polyphenol oxidase family protein [Muribaculaceae bacterium]|nr:polyphenol oxidase family protein [Muribaculaceae bacterium]
MAKAQESITTNVYTIMDGEHVKGAVLVCRGRGVRKGKDIPDFFDTLATTPVQTHSLNVRVVDGVGDSVYDDTDALVTFVNGVTIGVRTADCVPILLYAEDVNGVAAIHAGWKGTLGGILDRTLDLLEDRGADLSRLKVAFGPSISSGNYEVDSELAGRFIEAGFTDYVTWPGGAEGKPHIDLQGVNIKRLRRRGVRDENIKPSEFCTLQSVNEEGEYMFPSYRRDGAPDERLMTCITLLDE